MADLTENQKIEIVEALAGYQTPSAIIAHFRLEHDVELTHKQVGRYDPTRPYFEAGEKWRDLFEARRRSHLENVHDVPVAHKAYRLNLLQSGVDAARKAGNWLLVAKLLEQAAREVGGMPTNGRRFRAEDEGHTRARDMTPEDRKAALAEVIRRAMELRGVTSVVIDREAA